MNINKNMKICFRCKQDYKDSEKFIKEIINDYMDTGIIELHILKNEYGKPFILKLPNVHFNISHTRNIIIGAISDKPVGIDIETIKPFNSSVVRRFFVSSEQKYIFANQKNQNIRFCEIWTRKEAYVKWLGKGMNIPFDSFNVLNNNRIETFKLNGYIYSVCS